MKTSGWNVLDQESAKYLIDWALAACCSVNKSNGSRSSQLGLPIADFDQFTDNFNDWVEARLVQTLGTRAKVVAPGGGLGSGVGGVQPIFQVNMPSLPQPSLSQIDMACNRGPEAHKRTTDTAVVSGTKYTPKQLVHLMAFCGLSNRDKDLLPEIWTHLQSIKSWQDAATKLRKWFTSFESVGDAPVQFDKELVDDIRKLMFYLGGARWQIIPIRVFLLWHLLC